MKQVTCMLALASLPEGEPEPNAGRLKTLIDVAYASGDLKRAEHFIERLYAHYDRQEHTATA
jgi:hypothetical protein